MCPPRFPPLCGDDEYTGKNYDHRKGWIVERLAFLGAIFAIDVCAYAVLSTHFHVVLRVMAHLVQQRSNEEVLRRVGRLCPSTVTGVDKWPESKRRHFIKRWRERLSSISWFMGELVETFGALGGFVGHPDRLRERAEQLGQRWIKGQGRRSSVTRSTPMALAA